jgi:hypothetical protein
MLREDRAVLNVDCPQCANQMRAPDHFAGKKAKCGKCGHSFLVPTSDEPIEFASIDEPVFVPETGDPSPANDVAGGWHFAQDGQSNGPISTVELKRMAKSGHLRPTDLVWREGLNEWIPAAQVPNLCPPRSAPPPVPRTAQGPGPQAPVLRQGAYPVAIPAASSGSRLAPALWNPGAAGIWSLILSMAFGSLLVALNWRSLGEVRQAKRAMLWFYGALAVFGVELLIPITALRFLIVPLVNLGLLLAWNFAECERQRKLLKRDVANQYVRRGWFVPIVLAIVCLWAYGYLGSLIQGLIAPPIQQS